MKIYKLSRLSVFAALFLCINTARANDPTIYDEPLEEDEIILEEVPYLGDEDPELKNKPLQDYHKWWYCGLVSKETTEKLNKLKLRNRLSDPEELDNLLIDEYSGKLVDAAGNRFKFLLGWEERLAPNKKIDAFSLKGIAFSGATTQQNNLGFLNEITVNYQYCRTSKLGDIGSRTQAFDNWHFTLEPNSGAANERPNTQIWNLKITRDKGAGKRGLVGIKKTLYYKLVCGKYSTEQDGLIDIKKPEYSCKK